MKISLEFGEIDLDWMVHLFSEPNEQQSNRNREKSYNNQRKLGLSSIYLLTDIDAADNFNVIKKKTGFFTL